MTGYLRFFLAVLVMLSHMGFRVEGMNPGVFAVVIFYMLAGHVVTHLIYDVFWKKEKAILKFYLDRILRIFPMYLFVSCLTIFFLLLTSFGNPEFKKLNLLNNFLVIPLNYYMYIYTYIIILTSTNPPWWLIPPAWSLGAELQVYFLLPFLFRFPVLGVIAFLCTLCVYSLANLSLIHSDYFGYRLLVGVLFIFMLGGFLQKIKTGKASRWEIALTTGTYLFCIVWFLYFVLGKHTYGAYTRETLLGIIVGLPVVYLSMNFRVRLPFNRLLGNLSYGLFLAHFPAIWFFEYLGIKKTEQLLPDVFLLSVFVSYLGVTLIEKRIEKIRFRL